MLMIFFGVWAISGIIGVSYLRWRDYLVDGVCVTPSQIFYTFLIGSICGSLIFAIAAISAIVQFVEWIQTVPKLKSFWTWWHSPLCRKKEDNSYELYRRDDDSL